MRKAFDANVPKLRPRLKSSAPAATVPLEESATEGAGSASPTQMAVEGATRTTSAAQAPIATATPPTTTATPTPTATTIPTGTPTPKATRAIPTAIANEAPARASDVLSRKDRLDKIKRRVAEASRPAPRVDPVPPDPARAAESVLGLVRDLEAELVRVREREEALRADLDEGRHELSRAASEGRAAAEAKAVAEKELEEKRGVLAEMLEEMQALEDERDESVRRAQALAALDEERARLLEEVTRRADEEARIRAEREAEVERLSEELRAAGSDGARLRAAVGELARERDQLAQDLDRACQERDDLAAAKGALEQVHAALAQARARLG
jgi:hypothetical protein